MSLRPRHLAALLLAVPLLLTGCSDSDSPADSGSGSGPAKSGSRPEVSATPRLSTANDKAMPLDSYLLNPQQTKTLDNAYSSLVTTCMRRFGFDYSPPAATADSGAGSEAPATRTDGRFGYQSMAHAQKWGYHPEGGNPASQKGVWAREAKRLTADMRIASQGSADPKQKFGPGGQTLNGEKVPDHGCVGTARKTLTGRTEGDIGDADLATQIKFETLVKGQEDARTQKVFARWSACMKKDGYAYPDPLKALGDSKWSKSAQPGTEEIRVAVADQKCREKDNVVGVWFAVDYAYQEQAVEDNAEALAAVRKSIDTRLKAANDALAG